MWLGKDFTFLLYFIHQNDSIKRKKITYIQKYTINKKTEAEIKRNKE